MKQAQKVLGQLTLAQILLFLVVVIAVVAIYLDYTIYSSSKNVVRTPVNSKNLIKLEKDQFDKMETAQQSDITEHQNGSIGRPDPFAGL